MGTLKLVPESLHSAEILDFGYPQNSETGALKTFITQQGIKSQVGSFCTFRVTISETSSPLAE